MSVNHYENFPVASILVPRALRYPIHTIYQFAREADDFADEGQVSAHERLANLQTFRSELMLISEKKSPTQPLFHRLASIIEAHGLPIQLFLDLLDAFSQDVVKKRYANFSEVMNYCRRSADPIGRLLLHLYRAVTPENLKQSDAICSSLQLINFWQDIAIDFEKDRIYLPQDELSAYGISENQIAEQRINEKWRALLEFQINRSQKMLESGAPLGNTLPGRLGLELRLIVQGGLCILDKLKKTQGDIYQRRPVLKTPDWIAMFFRALINYPKGNV
jgi:squalene synthase HpnC